MGRCLVLPSLFGCLVSLPIAAQAVAQSPPRSLGNDIVTARSRLTPSQLAQVKTWVDWWSPGVDSGDPETVEKAREDALKPLTGLMVPSELFRFEYGRLALPHLKRGIASDTAHAAVNAMIVLPQLGTSAALYEILEHCDRDDDDRTHIRLRAAKGCKSMLERARDFSLEPKVVIRAVRELRESAKKEVECLILHHQFEAMAVVDDAKARDYLVDALEVVVQRIDGEGRAPSELVEAVYLAIYRLSRRYVTLPSNEQDELGKRLGPVLGRVCKVARDHWEDAHGDPVAKQTYGGTIRVSEEFLKIIDSVLRDDRTAPRTQLKRHWDAADRPKFDTDRKRWSDILQKPPYRP